MGLLGRDAILGADDLAFEVVEVPEWGGSVRVRGLTGRERDLFEASIVQVGSAGSRQVRPRLENIRARLVSMTLVDEEGNLLFSDRDVRELGAKSAAILDRLFDVARRLSGLTEGDVQAIAEDFGGAQSGDSGSI